MNSETNQVARDNVAKNLLKNKPLLVSDPLIRPISNGRKTETRRVNGLDWVNELPDEWEFVSLENNAAKFKRVGVPPEICTLSCRYGPPGTILWVRENWYVGRGYNGVKPRDIPAGRMVKRGYMGDGPRPEWAGRVRPSMHMPRWLCRYELEVLKIGVERVQSITEDGAKREGVQPGIFRDGPNTEKGEFHLEHNIHGSHLAGFKFTWMTLNGRQSWDLNPWVWVISFKLKNPIK